MTKNLLIKILLPFILLITLASHAATNAPLPANQAFIFTSNVERDDRANITWQVAPGYYLYRDRIHIKGGDGVLATPTFPQGEYKYSKDLGRYEVLSGLVNVPIQLLTQKQQVTLSVEYQGCSESGFCYPPAHKNLTLNLINLTVTENQITKSTVKAKIFSLLTDQNGIKNLLTTEHLVWVWIIFIGLGLLLAFTPCVLPMIPILTGIIVGQKGTVTTKKAFMLSLTYVLGSSITYAFAGFAAASMGSSLQAWLQQPWIIVLTSILFLILALSLFGLFELRVPYWWQNRMTHLSNRQRGGNYAGVFAMGIISTLIISPCVTAPLVGVLLYIAEKGSILLGVTALFALGIGMGIPLLLIGISAGKWLPKRGAWMIMIKQFFGLLMLAMAIWLLGRIVSPSINTQLWGVWFIALSIVILYLPSLLDSRKLNRFAAGMLSLYGLFVLVGLYPNRLQPALHPDSIRPFIVVNNLTDLQKQLTIAKSQQKPVLVDFYADWCESCISMEKNVFQSVLVQNKLQQYILIRADLTANETAEEALQQHYAVIAPPTVLFFDNQGRELSSKRIVGEVTPRDFLLHLKQLG